MSRGQEAERIGTVSDLLAPIETVPGLVESFVFSLKRDQNLLGLLWRSRSNVSKK